jgi:hypothetical protein
MHPKLRVRASSLSQRPSRRCRLRCSHHGAPAGDEMTRISSATSSAAFTRCLTRARPRRVAKAIGVRSWAEPHVAGPSVCARAVGARPVAATAKRLGARGDGPARNAAARHPMRPYHGLDHRFRPYHGLTPTFCPWYGLKPGLMPYHDLNPTLGLRHTRTGSPPDRHSGHGGLGLPAGRFDPKESDSEAP